jgi:uncharacterized protein DUF3710
MFSRNRGKRDADIEPDLPDSDDFEDELVAPGYGPFDVADAPDVPVERIDFGALQIPAVPGVEVRFQATPQGEIGTLVLVHAQSQLQLGVYAAPRSEGIWNEIRDLIAGSLKASGARAEEIEGDYGPELRARVRDETGQTATVRHVGIDGPRWFVHAIFGGAAGADPDADEPLRDVMRNLVVNRGTDARPVKESLPLRLPPQAVAAAAEEAEAEQAKASAEPVAGGTNGKPVGRPTARRKA